MIRWLYLFEYFHRIKHRTNGGTVMVNEKDFIQEEYDRINVPQYAVELPYPEIRVEEVKDAYIPRILENIGGLAGEMTAAYSYMYGDFMTGEKYDEVKKALKGIAISEMNHMYMFVEVAKQLGADPRLWSQKGNTLKYWSPEYIQYPTQLENIIKANMEAEQTAIDMYTQQIENIQDPGIVTLLKRILLDEKLHYEIMADLYNKFC